MDFNVKIPQIVGGSSVGWVGQSKVTSVSALALDQIVFKPSKIAGIVVISEELGRSSDPIAEMVVQNDLSAAVAAFSDRQFLDPSVAEVADTNSGERHVWRERDRLLRDHVRGGRFRSREIVRRDRDRFEFAVLGNEASDRGLPRGA